ncbi:MAG: succinate dehydrogenase, cytochrome b556 subunit [Thiomonas arsenitoxydans]|uniref:Succinate dehydrogenase cytochrome b556 subunit n=1 Tax=Thiomonas arsenitoxydans (strain DSM 22701 / CIP 110005 / 3As) TaxID=426114 RepID=A0A8I1MSV6_THIA3|nr:MULTISPECIES: succinate dehydrogenase, cytochrome b556 subunit [Thiomonas]MBN8742818.1 succinate dehydrogenase, cytochrome b556 subunit [Thiomonas arsenitoxydans]ODU97951.1 MAG: succinate dehydrogenase, cytochrome b556 subunit [Thiomonas sp. SCN 64-16]
MTKPASPPARPVYRNIHISQIVGYRLPLAGLVSILHRISGAVMFLALPLVLWAFDDSLRSADSHATITQFLSHWFVKLILLGLFWALMHHLVAGVRHLWMDAFHAVSKAQGLQLALITFAVSLGLTALFGLKLLGVY